MRLVLIAGADHHEHAVYALYAQDPFPPVGAPSWFFLGVFSVTGAETDLLNQGRFEEFFNGKD